MEETTKEDFEYFKERCEYWSKILGVINYSYHYSHTSLSNGDFINEEIIDITQGGVEVNQISKTATIFLNTNWCTIKVSKEKLDKVAFHEILEILFDRLETIASNRYVSSESSIRTEVHSIIRTLENVMYHKLK